MVPLPKTSADIVTDQSRCQDIIDYVSSISDELRDGEVTARQACYLPNVQTASGGPLIGETGVKGLFMAAGHTCWGIAGSQIILKLGLMADRYPEWARYWQVDIRIHL